MEYIYEIHRRTTVGDPYHVCILCDDAYFDVVVHISSDEHRSKYVKKHIVELEDMLMPIAPRKGTKHYGWFLRKYMVSYIAIFSLIYVI